MKLTATIYQLQEHWILTQKRKFQEVRLHSSAKVQQTKAKQQRFNMSLLFPSQRELKIVSTRKCKTKTKLQARKFQKKNTTEQQLTFNRGTNCSFGGNLRAHFTSVIVKP